MSQENPFPNQMPKVGDVVRIIRVLPAEDMVEEALVLKRHIGYGALGIRTKTVLIEVGPAACDRYYYDEDNLIWYQMFHIGRTCSVYRIEVVNQKGGDDGRAN